MSDETRSFLIDLVTYLRGHGHRKAARDLMNQLDDEGAKHEQ